MKQILILLNFYFAFSFFANGIFLFSNNEETLKFFLSEPVAICQDITIPLDPTLDCLSGMITAEQIDNGSFDPDGDPLILILDNYGSFSEGDNLVFLTVVAGAGMAQCSANVFVADYEFPVADCKDFNLPIDENGNATITVANVDEGSIDNCELDAISIDISNFDCSEVGIHNGSQIALQFDGVDDFVQLPGTWGLNWTELTIEAWVKVDASSPDFQAILSSSNTDFIHLQLHPNAGSGLYTDNGYIQLPNIMSMPTNEWRHIAVSARSGEIKTYLNGVQLGPTLTNTFSTIVPSSFLTVGRGFNEGRHLDGAVDELRIWNSVRTSTEIYDNLDEELNGNEPGLYAYYNFESGTNSSTAFDQTINNNHAVLNNMDFAEAWVPSSFIFSSNAPFVTLAATDINNNTSYCISTIMVHDLIPPVASCQNLALQLDVNGQTSITPEMINLSSSDNCNFDLSIDIENFTCSDASAENFALRFDGFDDYVSLPGDDWGLNQVEFTIEAWIKSEEDVIQHPQTIFGNHSESYVTFQAHNNLQSTVSTPLGPLPFPVISAQPLSNWRHVALVYENGYRLVYENGVLRGVIGEFISTAVNPADSVYIGRGLNGGNHFKGCIDELRIWRKARTDVEILANMNKSLNGNEPFLSNYYDFNGGPGSTILRDRSLDTLDGILQNMDPFPDLVTGISDWVVGAPIGPANPNVVTLTVSDAANNVDQCTSLVSVSDNIDPTAICHNPTIYLDALGQATITKDSINNNSFDACGIYSMSIDISSFNCSNIGPNTVTLAVKDSFNNVGTCQAFVFVMDTILPTALCKDADVYLDGNGLGILSSSNIDNGSFDDCGIQSISLVNSSFDCSDVGVVQMTTLRVTDWSGNIAECSAMVSIKDTILPIVICQDFTAQLDGTGVYTITPSDIIAQSSEACGIEVFSIDMSTFDCDSISNQIGNQHALHFDGMDDYIQLPGTWGGPTWIELTIEAWVKIDDVVPSLQTIISSANLDFVHFQLGTNAVAYTNSGPDVVLPDGLLTPLNTWKHIAIVIKSGDSKMYVDGVQIGATSTAQFAHINATSNLTIGRGFNGVRHLKGCIDDLRIWSKARSIAEIASTMNVELFGNEQNLQAYYEFDDGPGASILLDKSVHGNHGVYQNIDLTQSWVSGAPISSNGLNTVTLTAIDSSNNASFCTSVISIEDTIPPSALCQNITIPIGINGYTSITINDVDNGSSDNCAIDTIILDISTFDCLMTGQNTVTLTVKDINNNESSCQSIVMITGAPTALCKNIDAVLDENGQAHISANDIDNGSSANCGLDTLIIDVSSFDCSNIGSNTVTLTLRDIYNNEGSCQSVVSVLDTIAPIALCKNAVVFLGPNGAFQLSPNDIDNGSFDDCGIQSMIVNPSLVYCPGLMRSKSSAITLTVTDNGGNSAQCDSDVTYTDTIAPIFQCKNIALTIDGSGQVNINPGSIIDQFLEPCGLESLTLDVDQFNCDDINPLSLGQYALNFDGIDDFIDLPGIWGGPGWSELTMEAWVNLDSSTTDLQALASSFGAEFVHLNLHPISGSATFTNANANILPAIPQEPINTWRHIALSIKSGETIIYVDGIQIGASNLAVFDYLEASSLFRLGRGAAGGRYLFGSMDEFRIWNVAKTQAEIIAHKDQKLTGQETGLYAYYDFENGPGSSTITDRSGNGNDGVLMNMDVSNDWVTGAPLAQAFDQLVMLTATDIFGNSSSCSAGITIIDNQLPIALCTDAIVELDENGIGNLTPAEVDNGSSDACGVALSESTSLTLDKSTFDCSDLTDRNHSLQFDGVNDYIQLPGTWGGPDWSELSIEAWVKIESESSEIQALVSSFNADFVHFNLHPTSASAVYTNTGFNLLPAIPQAPVQTWRHVVMSIKSGETRMYVDGVQVGATNTKTFNHIRASNNFLIGLGFLGGRHFRGSIDELRIWEIAIDFQDIYDYMNMEITGQEYGLYAYYNFNDGPGSSILADKTGHGHDGILMNMDVNEDWQLGVPISIPTTHEVMMTVTDINGNSAQCNSVVSVYDTIKPNATCQNITIQLDQSAIASISEIDIDNGSSDACSIDSLKAIPSSFTCADLGANNVALIVKDISGNIDTCTSIVTVQDQAFPNNRMVKSNVDSGPNTLRQIIDDACPNDTIDFDPVFINDTIRLTGSHITLNDRNLTIRGFGIDQLFISGENNDHVFQLDDGDIATLEKLNVVNGMGPIEAGGGILNDGTLILENVRMMDNLSGGNEFHIRNMDGSVLEIKGELIME